MQLLKVIQLDVSKLKDDDEVKNALYNHHSFDIVS